MMEIGNVYEVITGEDYQGNIYKQDVKLERIENYHGTKVYVYHNEDFEYVVSYEGMDEKNIDWDLISLFQELYI